MFFSISRTFWAALPCFRSIILNKGRFRCSELIKNQKQPNFVNFKWKTFALTETRKNWALISWKWNFLKSFKSKLMVVEGFSPKLFLYLYLSELKKRRTDALHQKNTRRWSNKNNLRVFWVLVSFGQVEWGKNWAWNWNWWEDRDWDNLEGVFVWEIIILSKNWCFLRIQEGKVTIFNVKIW